MTRPDPIKVPVEVDLGELVQALRVLSSGMRAIAEKADEVADSLAGALDSDDDVDLDESEASS